MMRCFGICPFICVELWIGLLLAGLSQFRKMFLDSWELFLYYLFDYLFLFIFYLLTLKFLLDWISWMVIVILLFIFITVFLFSFGLSITLEAFF